MKTLWGACFRALRPRARKKALEKWGYDTPHAAMEAGNMEALRFLLDQQASISEKVHGETALQVAIRKRNFEAIRWIATCGANPRDAGAFLNARDVNGDTPLSVAAREGDLELASVLIEVGARTECRNKAGYSAIMWSAVKGNVQMTSLLLEKGASPNVPPWAWKTFGKSPLTEAVFGGNLEVVKMLVEAGAHLYDRDGIGRTPLDLAKNLGKAEIEKYLREKFSAIEEPDEYGDTALLRAVKEDDLEGALSLLKRGANATVRNRRERTPILCAVINGNLQMVKLLIENSLEARFGIDGGDILGCTALMYAARDGDFEMVKYLVANGANVNAQSKIKRAPCIVARAKRKKRLLITQYRRSARIETSSEIGFTALTYAAKRGHTQIVKFLIEQGADVNARDCYNRTVLMQVLIGGNSKLEIIKLLIKHGADIHARSMDGSSAIHFASIRGRAPFIAYLLEHGADEGDLSFSGWTPLMQVSAHGAINSVILLIKHGADVDMMEEFGRTALFFAVKSKRINVVKYLLECKANPNVMDEYTQKTALDIAKEKNYQKIAELLRAYGAKE